MYCEGVAVSESPPLFTEQTNTRYVLITFGGNMKNKNNYTQYVLPGNCN